jgi:hypothetical protein
MHSPHTWTITAPSASLRSTEQRSMPEPLCHRCNRPSRSAPTTWPQQPPSTDRHRTSGCSTVQRHGAIEGRCRLSYSSSSTRGLGRGLGRREAESFPQSLAFPDCGTLEESSPNSIFAWRCVVHNAPQCLSNLVDSMLLSEGNEYPALLPAASPRRSGSARSSAVPGHPGNGVGCAPSTCVMGPGLVACLLGLKLV